MVRYVVLIMLILLLSCSNKNNKLSVLALQMDTVPIISCKKYLEVIIFKNKPDLLSLYKLNIPSDSLNFINKNGYVKVSFENKNYPNILAKPSLFFNSKSIKVLESGIIVLKTEYSNSLKNSFSWIKMENNNSGHLFYLVSLKLYIDVVNDNVKELRKVIYNRIDKVIGTSPMIVICDLYSDNLLKGKHLKCQIDSTLYLLDKEKHTLENTCFFYNKHIKINEVRNVSSKNDSIKNLNLKFTINTKKFKVK